jgi:2-polyprenyl-6-methoxyphenol hydroxylase-like FAD-dependent oxidoreductase
MSTPASPSIDPAPAIRVAVLGAGHVGVTFAYTLLLSGLASEIVEPGELDRLRRSADILKATLEKLELPA